MPQFLNVSTLTDVWFFYGRIMPATQREDFLLIKRIPARYKIKASVRRRCDRSQMKIGNALITRFKLAA
jgi:hypothetical protein